MRELLDLLRRRIEEDFGLVALEYNPEVSGPTPLPIEGMVEQLPELTELAPEVDRQYQSPAGTAAPDGPD